MKGNTSLPFMNGHASTLETAGRRLSGAMSVHQLNDNNGKGRKAWMTWGGGLHPAWQPTRFGVVTLVKRILL